MALTKCKDCKAEISKKAKACPQCGAPAKKKTSLFTWLVLIAILAFVFVPLLAPSSPKKAVAKPVAVEKQQPVTEQEKPKLEDDARRNAIAELFKGKEEQTAKDAVWTSWDMFKVGVLNNGTPRNGYAEYVCQVLYEHGFKGEKIRVQVIDIVKLANDGKWERLGQARCI